MRAFIVRPFGTKRGINFDRVETDLIAKALDQLGIMGRTTAEIMRPGSIREDMFQLLLTADLVVADITLHNANVYYELGIRHALRDRMTVLLRGVGEEHGEMTADAVPFDLLTDRYLTYQLSGPDGLIKEPEVATEALVAAIAQGRASGGRDSPVFKLLPKLRAPSPDEFLAVPVDFEEEVERTISGIAKRPQSDERTLFSGDLGLLAHEARLFPWAGAGLRLVGRKQFDGKHFEGARLTWEEIRRRDGQDLEANLKLTTICQKLGDLSASNAAAQRVLSRSDLSLDRRAEIHALQASNLKVQWLRPLQDLPSQQRGEAALRSGLLPEAVESYEAGFRADRNHYYSAINALALRVVQRELAQCFPEVWELSIPERDGADPRVQAELELGRIKERIDRLGTGVTLALESADAFEGPENAVWRAFTAADRTCLISNNPARVAEAFRRTIEKFREAFSFALSSAQSQLELLQLVGVLEKNVTAGLACFPAKPTQDANKRGRIVLFTGHRIDDADRTAKGKPPRFPRTTEAEEIARQAVKASIQRALASPQGIAFGLAGGASGGDILFHEVCETLAVPTWLYLALPVGRYKNESVRGAGDSWLRRFDQLQSRLETRSRCMPELRSEAGEPDKLPRWLQALPNYDIWQRNNLWMLHNALSFGPDRVTLVALWDEEAEGDGPGGTAHLVELARNAGAEVDILNSKSLFGLAQ
ncbi:tetratricopeptide repeat-containing protein [Methylobacterium frigidaeris]|uniref:DUF4071 domain-containing protein n=1 Tax=Methylobacterium frigidaeris TaxID=2038277 RepID=A0AA37HJL3_9HYPH|nr:tetratricopeptide repeat-containing protein [Methylobacterium frigidaeris]GJD66992.1 hypothetical protein MPEAHAMD_7191 [Methylobacterium frigidaeris]